MVQNVGKRTSVNKPDQQVRTARRSDGRQPASSSTRTYTQRARAVDIGPGAYTRPPTAEKPLSQIRTLHLRLDTPLLLTVVTLIVLGLVILYSASYDYSRLLTGDPYAMIKRQVLWAVLGVGAMIFCAFFDYHIYQRLAFPALLATCGLLIGVLLVNEITNNAVRSLWEGSIRPSELAKLVVVLYVSVWLFARQERLTKISLGLAPLSVVLGVVGGLIFRQPDLSAVVTVFFLISATFFLAGGDIRQFGLMILFGTAIGLLVAQFSTTASDRIFYFIEGWKNPLGVSDHVRGALEGFVNGGWFGKGLGKGIAKLLDLPVAPTDSIFAVVGEELGVLGSVVLVGLFVFLLWRGISIARKAPDQLGALLAAGLCIWVAFEAFVNMAVVLNVLPFAGNALPFISAGGSSLVITLTAMGIVLNVARQSVTKERESDFSAFVNLRRGNRRRSVSRPDNLAGSQ
jgi:cell division protein FtsW